MEHDDRGEWGAHGDGGGARCGGQSGDGDQCQRDGGERHDAVLHRRPGDRPYLSVLPENLCPRSYELRLFANDTLTRLATSNAFEVVAGPGVSVSPAAVAAGGTLAVTWTGIAEPTTTDRRARVAQRTRRQLRRVEQYDAGAASGGLELALPESVPPGPHELRLFAQNTYQRLAVSNLVTVGPTLVMSPTSVAPGGTVTITWAGGR